MDEPAFQTSDLLSSPIIAGFIGALVSRRFAPTLNRWEFLGSVASGAVMAHYFTPMAGHLLGLPDFSGGVGFAIGLLGLNITAAVYEAIKNADPWGFIMARWGQK